MPSRKLPNSNPKRYRALRMINDRKTVTPPAEVPLNSATIMRFDLFFPTYKSKILAIAAALSAQGAASALVKTAKQLAGWVVDDFYEALQRAVRRGVIDAAQRPLYSLDMNETGTPKLSSEQDILDWGEHAHDGETARVAGGGVPITFPSLAELDNATADFKTKNLNQAAAKTAYDNAQQALVTDNTEADKLVLKCWNEIETNFDEGDKPSMRRQAREWGVVYIPAKGETLDPDEFSVKGKVTDLNTGNGIEDVELKVVQTSETILSESNGDYLITYLLPGIYTLEASKAGYTAQTLPGIVVTAGNITGLDIELTPVAVTGTVSGTVSLTGIPVSGATVSIEGFPLLTAVTNPAGLYSIGNIPAGAQNVKAQMPPPSGALPQVHPVTVVAGSEVTDDFNF